MTLEIERRFLLKNDRWKEFITKKTFIEQGYLSNDLNSWIVRIRFNGDHFKIALKRHISNFTNFEFEYLIPNSDGEKIMSNLKNIIQKERFFLEVEQKIWVVDCFKGKNFPLEIAEIELSKEEEKFSLPIFVAKEITGIKNFSNVSLANFPYSTWKNKDAENIKKN